MASSLIALSKCAKADRKFIMLQYFKRSRPTLCLSKVSSLTDEVLRCANKEVESVLKEKASSSDECRGKYNDYTLERDDHVDSATAK